MFKLNYEIIDVKQEEKEKLYKLLQYALYDGSQYIDNDISKDCIFKYRCFDNYFTDKDRNVYFIKSGNYYVGMVMVNENLKVIGKFNEWIIILLHIHFGRILYQNIQMVTI